MKMTVVNLSVLFGILCIQLVQGDQLIKAVCNVRGAPGTVGANAFGKVVFTQSASRMKRTFQHASNPVFMDIDIVNLPDGAKGFHVHEFGDLSNTTNPCLSTGPHYNPEGVTHGGPQDDTRHVGDLGNILVINSVVRFLTNDDIISLQGPHSIVGRALVIHEKEDDFGRGGKVDSKTTGAAGSRIACCVIGLADPKI